MKRICAWCKKVLEKNQGRAQTDISHGICDDCMDKYFFSKPVELMKLLDGLSAPVIMVDHDAVVKTANKAARKLLKKDLPAMENSRSGNVFECVYASLPEGCGKTVHCSGCAIRKSVTETYKTGKHFYKRPAYLRHDLSDNTKEHKYLISTAKLGDSVLLRIDEVKK